ncbi:uncharacterized protein FOMMEDRAFT_24213 [Fomitiporia mediterranea MF3/22]|uniref:Uncharacterized protein n=1 Tax=Fomitiporia mediterranea (strain MF3/22) TaxID=694068 RepID=R7SH98_FOMME|nr:uncharacterized protein FOMMEDRAFT_24213 [Fomitiporia mediterranea MF3/22]EJC97760.1 hypothetical protein FOMMEDRAFT_24213 [Fomitiporia mediterranea MF3/22]
MTYLYIPNGYLDRLLARTRLVGRDMRDTRPRSFCIHVYDAPKASVGDECSELGRFDNQDMSNIFRADRRAVHASRAS